MSVVFDILRTRETLRTLREEWTALLHRAQIASPFLTWEWMDAWWETYCGESSARRLVVVTARRDGQLAAILPGYVRQTQRLGLLEFAFLGTEFESTDYLQVIEEAREGTLLTPLLAALLKAEPRLDVIVFENVLASHDLLISAQLLAAESGFSFESEPHRTCPYLAVQGEWDDYLSSLSPKMRKNVRRATRQLLDAGAEFSTVDARHDVAEAVQELFDLHARRFVTKNETTGFRADIRAPFHTRVSELFLQRDFLRLFRVRVEGRTIAALYCFEFNEELFYFQSGIDPDWEKVSIGTALVGHAIKHAFDKQLRLFDFMRGAEEYKFRWTNTVREIVVARVGTSRKGRAALAMRRQGLRAKQLAKRIIRPDMRPSATKAATI